MQNPKEISSPLDTVVNDVKSYFTKHTSISVDSLGSLDEDLKYQGLDSLQLIRIVIWIEEQTDKSVSVEKLFCGDELSIMSISEYIHSNIQ